jgi:hypothetical protein
MNANPEFREQKTIEKHKNNIYFFLVIYFIVEYVRPQDLIKIGFLRLGLLTILCLSLFVFFYPEKRKLFSNQINLIISFVLLIVLYVPLAINTYYAYHAALALILLLPAILAIVITIDSHEMFNKISWLFSLISICLSLIVFKSNGYGPGGIVGDANDVGLFLVMMLPFSYYLLLIEKKLNKRLVLIFVLGITIGAIAYTSSRGAFVGLIAVVSVLFLYSKHKFKITAILLLLSLCFLYFADEAFLGELKGITDTQESTANERLLSWQSSWNMFVDNPLGVGGGNFPVHFTDYQVDGFYRSDMWGRAAHSLWFTLLPETGLIGTMLFFLIIYKNYKMLFRIVRENKPVDGAETRVPSLIHLYSISLIASFSGFLSAATFLSVLYYPHFWILTSLIVATNNISENSENWEIS